MSRNGFAKYTEVNDIEETNYDIVTRPLTGRLWREEWECK